MAPGQKKASHRVLHCANSGRAGVAVVLSGLLICASLPAAAEENTGRVPFPAVSPETMQQARNELSERLRDMHATDLLRERARLELGRLLTDRVRENSGLSAAPPHALLDAQPLGPPQAFRSGAHDDRAAAGRADKFLPNTGAAAAETAASPVLPVASAPESAAQPEAADRTERAAQPTLRHSKPKPAERVRRRVAARHPVAGPRRPSVRLGTRQLPRTPPIRAQDETARVGNAEQTLAVPVIALPKALRPTQPPAGSPL